MNLQELEATNQATLKAIRESATEVDWRTHPYRGYYPVDIFESPPFLMFTNHDCPRAGDILYNREFEPQSMRLWCRFARRATGILDIGAHVGVYSLAAAAIRRDISIHAFEPNPHAYTRLRMHKMVNGFDNIFEHTVGVGDKKGYTDFSWVKKPTQQISSGAGLGKRKGEDIERIIVPVETLDGLELANTLGNRPLVKIDVEGGEINAFRGMSSVLALKPDIILETFQQEACDAITDMLPDGYRVFKIAEREGHIVALSRLRPANAAGRNLNQFLTTADDRQIMEILNLPPTY